MLDVLRAQRTEAGLQIDAADAAYRGGRGTQADVFAARSMVAQIDDRIVGRGAGGKNQTLGHAIRGDDGEAAFFHGARQPLQ
jgi:hypothetical protein